MPRVVVLPALLLLFPVRLHAQIPDRPVNLKVLPEGTSTREVVARMRDITSALGVRCQHCHEGPEGPNLDLVDFDSDSRPAKETARAMMRMVARLNGELMAALPNRSTPPLVVDCITCHRGAPRPQMLEDTLQTVLEGAGVDSMIATYAALRGRYYGRFAYDFGERSLNVLAERLLAAARHTEVVRVLELNAQQFPDSWNVANLLGGAYERVGDVPRAIEQYRKVQRLLPSYRPAQERLRVLTGG